MVAGSEPVGQENFDYDGSDQPFIHIVKVGKEKQFRGVMERLVRDYTFGSQSGRGQPANSLALYLVIRVQKQ